MVWLAALQACRAQTRCSCGAPGCDERVRRYWEVVAEELFTRQPFLWTLAAQTRRWVWELPSSAHSPGGSCEGYAAAVIGLYAWLDEVSGANPLTRNDYAGHPLQPLCAAVLDQDLQAHAQALEYLLKGPRRLEPEDRERLKNIAQRMSSPDSYWKGCRPPPSDIKSHDEPGFRLAVQADLEQALKHFPPVYPPENCTPETAQHRLETIRLRVLRQILPPHVRFGEGLAPGGGWERMHLVDAERQLLIVQGPVNDMAASEQELREEDAAFHGQGREIGLPDHNNRAISTGIKKRKKKANKAKKKKKKKPLSQQQEQQPHSQDEDDEKEQDLPQRDFGTIEAAKSGSDTDFDDMPELIAEYEELPLNR